jgi:hypothetical protein
VGPSGKILTEAAAVTRTWAAEGLTGAAGDDAAFCKDSGTVVTATEQQLAACKVARAAVYASLEADPKTKTRIAKIRDLTAGDIAPAAISPRKPGG